MGENAKKTWDWHNTVVGVGYQAKGVVRQRVSEEVVANVVDMRQAVPHDQMKDHQSTPQQNEKNSKRKKKDKKDNKKSSSRRRRADSDSSDSSDSSHTPLSKKSKFNPLLQALSMRLRDNL